MNLFILALIRALTRLDIKICFLKNSTYENKFRIDNNLFFFVYSLIRIIWLRKILDHFKNDIFIFIFMKI
jgi:hypothetical protein